MKTSALLAPRTFTKGKPEEKFCGNCTQRSHCHPFRQCSQCGGKFRACLLGVTSTGFSHCTDHRSGK